MTKSIEYGTLMHDAMRGLIKKVLIEIRDLGALPGDHHFFITYDTQHPDVKIADWLKDQYPDEITVVMQHWFDNLDVNDDGFSVTLNFGDQPEELYIPYMAIQTFVDPSVEFGLRFEAHEDPQEDVPSDLIADMDIEADDETDPPSGGADVVSLDAFRKS